MMATVSAQNAIRFCRPPAAGLCAAISVRRRATSHLTCEAAGFCKAALATRCCRHSSLRLARAPMRAIVRSSRLFHHSAAARSQIDRRARRLIKECCARLSLVGQVDVQAALLCRAIRVYVRAPAWRYFRHPLALRNEQCFAFSR